MVDWAITFEVAFTTDPGAEPGGGAWTDLSSRLDADEPVDISLGSGRLSGGSEGSASLLLDNADRNIDPTNSAATYAPNLVPMRHARIRLTWDPGGAATVYPLFRGFVDAWHPTWSNFISQVSVRLVDGFAWLGLQDGDLDRPREMSHVRAEAILDAAGWSATLRDIDDGVVELEPLVLTSGNYLQAFRDVVEAEGGEGYCAPDGKITFRSRHHRFGATPDVTFGEGGVPFPEKTAQPAMDAHGITNTARLELDDGTVYEYVDTASVDDYGPRSVTVRDLPLREAWAVATAQWEVYRWGEPRLWVDGLVVQSTEDNFEDVLGLRVGHLAEIAHTPPAGAAVAVEKSIELVRYSFGATEGFAAFDLSPYFGGDGWLAWEDPAWEWDTNGLWAP